MNNLFAPVIAKSPGIINDALDGFILGKKLGSGMDREVFEYMPNPEAEVVKIEMGKGNFQNVMELLVYHRAMETKNPILKYLAKVLQISVYGCWMRMERTYPPSPNYKWPDKMPAMFNDFKKGNYGLTKDGRFVCHDYGICFAVERGFSMTMKKVYWYD